MIQASTVNELLPGLVLGLGGLGTAFGCGGGSQAEASISGRGMMSGIVAGALVEVILFLCSYYHVIMITIVMTSVIFIVAIFTILSITEFQPLCTLP